jgi:hypothetical protein
MEGKASPTADLTYEEIAGSTESLFRASTLRKICSASSAKDSLSYSPNSSQDISEFIRLKESVSLVKAQLASGSPEQVRASIDLLRSSSFKPAPKRVLPSSDMKPEREDRWVLMDPRKSAERLIALAENRAGSEGNIQVTTEVIMQVFREMGGKASVEQLITLVQRLKRADASGLNQRLAEEQRRTDEIKERLTESRTQVSVLSQSVKDHSGQVDLLGKAVSDLYSLTRDVSEAWCRERAALKSLQREPDEAATIKQSLQETEKRYAETRRKITAETVKVSEMRSKLTLAEPGVSVVSQTDSCERVQELKEAQRELLAQLDHSEKTLASISQATAVDLDKEIAGKEERLQAIKRERERLESGLRALIALAGG